MVYSLYGCDSELENIKFVTFSEMISNKVHLHLRLVSREEILRDIEKFQIDGIEIGDFLICNTIGKVICRKSCTSEFSYKDFNKLGW